METSGGRRTGRTAGALPSIISNLHEKAAWPQGSLRIHCRLNCGERGGRRPICPATAATRQTESTRAPRPVLATAASGFVLPCAELSCRAPDSSGSSPARAGVLRSVMCRDASPQAGRPGQTELRCTRRSIGNYCLSAAVWAARPDRDLGTERGLSRGGGHQTTDCQQQ